MRIGLAQINPTVGDLEGNVARCIEAVTASARAGAGLVVLPELAIPGCHPRDILFDPSFAPAVAAATADLAQRVADGPPVVVGTLAPADRQPPHHPGMYNAAMLLEDGAAKLVAAKRILPAHDVFAEPRWFVPGSPPSPITVAGQRVGILFGDDLDDKGREPSPAAELIAAGAETLVCLAAAPYSRGVLDERLAAARRPCRPLVYANLCGGNDELIYDGRSFALDGDGALLNRLAGFASDVRVVEFPRPGREKAGASALPGGERWEAEIFHALALGVRDFVQKNSLKHAWLGLSGGIDSALVATIATEALGPEHVSAVAIPSRYSDPRSTSSARELADALSIALHVVEIERLHVAAEETLGDLAAGGTTAENVQARLRALILMSFVNHHGGVLLNTSNKTELALGYGTLYGDLAGMLSPIGDLTKPDVYALARWFNAQRHVIPDFILDRPPSAELKPDQVDPFDYPVVSPAIERLVQEDRSNPILRRTEYKRWSGGVILKVSARAFGRGRMMPVTRK
ncbi:MAG: NAD(+) synthase [Anaerolineae bacterium]|jgi:NAD+ synthetase|nr:NAD(+) synthase [Anaerolineae bacterium]